MMATVTQELLGLFTTIQTRIDQKDMIPLEIICVIAEDITGWTRSVDLSGLDKKTCGVFGQMMSLVNRGMTGKTLDAQRAINTIRASLPYLNRALSKIIATTHPLVCAETAHG